MPKVDTSFLTTPADDLCGNPSELKPGNGTWDGEPGWPQRTGGGAQVPEHTYEGTPFDKGEK